MSEEIKNLTDSETIVRRIYSAYGSDSGILFGITDIYVVRSIIEFTIRQINRRIEERQQLKYKNQTLYEREYDEYFNVGIEEALLSSEQGAQVSDTTESDSSNEAETIKNLQSQLKSLTEQHQQEMFKKIQEININDRQHEQEIDNLKRDLVYWKLELSAKNEKIEQHQQEIERLKGDSEEEQLNNWRNIVEMFYKKNHEKPSPEWLRGNYDIKRKVQRP